MPALSVGWIVPDAITVAVKTAVSPSAPPKKAEGEKDQKENKEKSEWEGDEKDRRTREDTYRYCC